MSNVCGGEVEHIEARRRSRGAMGHGAMGWCAHFVGSCVSYAETRATCRMNGGACSSQQNALI